MKKLTALLMSLIIFVTSSITVNAQEMPDYSEPTRIRCTVYCDYGETKSGEITREGMVAMNNYFLGKTALLYNEDMDLIGVYEVKDTGGNKKLKNGTAVDVYRPDLDACHDWIRTYGDYVYIQIIDAEG